MPAYIFASLGVLLFVWPVFGHLPLASILNPVRLAKAWTRILLGGAHWDLPGLFEDHAFTSANGSVWSLPYEVLMYLGLGISWFTLLRHHPRLVLPLIGTTWIAVSLFLLSGGNLVPDGDLRFAGFRLLYLLEFLAMFGGGWMLAEVRWNALVAIPVLAVLVLLRFSFLSWPRIDALDGMILPLFVVAVGRIRSPALQRMPDWSYGFYLWAWPVQQCIVDIHPSIHPLSMFFLSTVATLPFAAFSWTFVERRFLRR